jgi:hypothetical protein
VTTVKIPITKVEIDFEGLEEDSDDWNGISNHDLENFAERVVRSAAIQMLGKKFGKTNAHPLYNETLNIYECHRVVFDVDEGVARAYFRKKPTSS